MMTLGTCRASKIFGLYVAGVFCHNMAHQQMPIWATEADIDEDVDLSLAIGNYGQGHFEDGMSSRLGSLFPWLISNTLAPIQHPQLDEAALIAIQQHMAQQAAFSQIPDVVKAVSISPNQLHEHIDESST